MPSSSDDSVTCTMAPTLVFPYLSVPLSSAGLQPTGPQGPGMTPLSTSHQAHTLPFPWEPHRPCLSPLHCTAQTQFPQGQGTSLPVQMSSSSSQGLTGSGREGISRPKPPSWPFPDAVSLALPGSAQESGQKQSQRPGAEVSNEASSLDTTMPALTLLDSPAPWPAPPSLWESWAGLGRPGPALLYVFAFAFVIVLHSCVGTFCSLSG